MTELQGYIDVDAALVEIEPGEEEKEIPIQLRTCNQKDTNELIHPPAGDDWTRSRLNLLSRTKKMFCLGENLFKDLKG